MSKKRLIGSFASVMILLVIAGVVEVLLLLFPAAPAGPATPAEETQHAQPAGMQPSANEVRAAELVKSDAVVVDGTPLQRVQAESLVRRAASYTKEVDHIAQKSTLSSGCEIVALSVALNAMGIQADPEDIASRHLRLGSNYATDYVGDPRTDGGGLPPSIVDAGNSWLEGQGLDVRVVDLTGTTFAGVSELVALGYPVVVWTTEGNTAPSVVLTTSNGFVWYLPEHCVVVYGVDGDDVLVSDSIEGLITRDRAEFQDIYEKCGNMAILVWP